MTDAMSAAAPATDGRMEKPIFLLGASGSGTTLLRFMLDSHPNIAIGPETGVMRLVKAHRFIPYWRFGKRWWERLGLTEQDLNLALRDFYGGFFERLAARDSKQRWGEKTPLHVWHIDEIAAVFDDAVFVGVVRHPASSIACLVDRFGLDLERATSTWLEMNRVLVHDGARLGDRFVLARYEDLAGNSEPLLRELLAWLDEPWSPVVLAHHDVGSDRREAELSWCATRLGEAEHNQVRGRIEGWARFFGYGLDEPRPSEALASASSTLEFLVTGHDLAERREVFADRLDLRRPAKPVHEGIFRPPPRRYATRDQDQTGRESVARPVPARARAALSGARKRLRA